MNSGRLIAVKAKSRVARQVPCRSCGKMITWFRSHPKNKAIPFDGDPVALKTDRDEETWEPIEYLDAAECHFATCPDAERFRR